MTILPIVHTLRCLVASQAFREWSVVFAEIVVAWVIYRELQQGRNVSFLEKATNFEMNKYRSKIYDAYFKMDPCPERADKASEMFRIHISKDCCIREACERQLALFNELGFVYRKHFWFVRNRLVKVLPHATIYLWVMCGEYICERRRNSGPWFAKPFLEFTLESIKYAIKFDIPLVLRSRVAGENKTLTITVCDLKTLRKQLENELRGSRLRPRFKIIPGFVREWI